MAFGLYLHWPYCESKCPYCDFNSHVADKIDHERWISAYRAEIARVAAEHPDEILQTIFFGGGTPSLMKPEVVEAVIDAATTTWRTANQVEISMEANPGSVEADRFKSYRAAGVNRVSLGIQSLDDQHLRLLGRKHDSQDALRAIQIAQNTFDRVNIDFIYARQNQTLEDWRSELSRALSLGTTHMSLYQLTIEDGTVFGRRHEAGQLRGLPDEDRSVDMFHMTQEMTTAAGLLAYEVSNHARPGDECQHNMIYWSGGRYAGIGPGAHGRVGIGQNRIATEAIRSPALWLEAVEKRGSGELPNTALDHESQTEEMILMGLRLSTGITLSRLKDAGLQIDRWASMHEMIETGHLKIENHALKATAEGRLLLNMVISRLVMDLPF